MLLTVAYAALKHGGSSPETEHNLCNPTVMSTRVLLKLRQALGANAIFQIVISLQSFAGQSRTAPTSG